MTSLDIEPLDTELWFERAANLLERFKATKADDELGAALRRAYHLLQLAPRPLRELLRPAISEARFEAFIDIGAHDSAAMGLVSEPAGLDLSRTLGASVFAARIWVTGTEATSTCVRDESAAKATLGALLEAIAALQASGAKDELQVEAIQSHLRPHRSQFEQRRQKKPH